MGHKPIEHPYKGDAQGQACGGHGAADAKNAQGGVRKVGHHPLGSGRIDVVVENAVQAHEDQRVLPQPDHGFLSAGHAGDQEHKGAAGNGGQGKEQHVAVGSEQNDHIVIEVKRKRSRVQPVGQQDNQKRDGSARQQDFCR